VDKLIFSLLTSSDFFPQDLLLQSTGPGPLDSEGVSVEDVLNIISQSIYREGEGQHDN
jgi:hypothetical protein